MAEKESFSKPGPLIFDAHAADNWQKFRMRFEIYLVASEKDEKPDTLKVNLLNCAGSEAIEESSHFEYWEDKSPENYEDVCHTFEQLCQGARNVIYERFVFNRRSQQEGERIDNFVSDLKRLSLACEFGAIKDSLIRDRIVGGVLSYELRGELLKKPDLTLQCTHDYCRTYEAADLQKFKFSQANEPGIHGTIHNSERHRKGPTKRCKFCGYQHMFTKPSICPAFKKKCLTCNKEGHFAKMCPNKGKRESNINAVEQELTSSDLDQEEKVTSHLYFGSVEVASIINQPSGVKKNLISLKVAQKRLSLKQTLEQKPLSSLMIFTRVTLPNHFKRFINPSKAGLPVNQCTQLVV